MNAEPPLNTAPPNVEPPNDALLLLNATSRKDMEPRLRMPPPPAIVSPEIATKIPGRTSNTR
jgi:hypothetical protein